MKNADKAAMNQAAVIPNNTGDELRPGYTREAAASPCDLRPRDAGDQVGQRDTIEVPVSQVEVKSRDTDNELRPADTSDEAVSQLGHRSSRDIDSAAGELKLLSHVPYKVDASDSDPLLTVIDEVTISIDEESFEIPESTDKGTGDSEHQTADCGGCTVSTGETDSKVGTDRV